MLARAEGDGPDYSSSGPVRHDERGENAPGKQELYVGGKRPIPVPAKAVVKELPSARTQEREDVLEVRG
jgi:hypothetical protein